MKKLNQAIFTAFLATFLTACGSKVPTEQNFSLPNVNGLKTITDTTEVAFEWSPVNDEKVNGYLLYRLNQSTNTYDVVAQINDRYATHYVDTNLAPETTYTYQMRTFSGDSISPSGASVSATTMPLMDSVAFSQAFSGLPNKVKIIWRPHTDPSVVGYVIKRANANSSDFDTIAQVEGRLQAEYIDNKVKANKTYSYTIHAKNNKGVLSKPSQVMSATTKELP